MNLKIIRQKAKERGLTLKRENTSGRDGIATQWALLYNDDELLDKVSITGSFSEIVKVLDSYPKITDN
jgi:hypothetical protein